MTGHAMENLKVRKDRKTGTPGGYQIQCSCGFRSEPTTTPEEASEIALRHTREAMYQRIFPKEETR